MSKHRAENPGHTPDDIDGTAEETSGHPDEQQHDGDMGVSSDRVGPVAGGRGTFGEEATYGDDDRAGTLRSDEPERS